MALVARPVRPKEVKTNPEAQAALDVEYNALCNDLKAWDMSGVREWFDVQEQAKRNGNGFMWAWFSGSVLRRMRSYRSRTPNESIRDGLCSRETKFEMKKT